MRAIATALLLAGSLAFAAPAMGGRVSTSVGLIIRESTGGLLSAGMAKYTNIFGYETSEYLAVQHWIEGTSVHRYDNVPAPYSWQLESDGPGIAGNCYSGELSASADDSSDASSSQEICYAGPVHPPGGFQTWDTGTNEFDPLVLDLNGDGIRTSGADRPVSFDIDADGRHEMLTWLEPQSHDAFLWTDIDQNGCVDDGAELFGVGTILPNGERARHGYEALAVYDRPESGGDANGLIDSGDAIWQHLRLWRDDDHDGVCDGGEWAPIHRYGVRSIGLTWVNLNFVDAAGTLHLLRGTFDVHTRGTHVEESVGEALGFRSLQ